MCGWHLNGNLASMPARSISLARPAVENGENTDSLQSRLQSTESFDSPSIILAPWGRSALKTYFEHLARLTLISVGQSRPHSFHNHHQGLPIVGIQIAWQSGGETHLYVFRNQRGNRWPQTSLAPASPSGALQTRHGRASGCLYFSCYLQACEPGSEASMQRRRPDEPLKELRDDREHGALRDLARMCARFADDYAAEVRARS